MEVQFLASSLVKFFGAPWPEFFQQEGVQEEAIWPSAISFTGIVVVIIRSGLGCNGATEFACNPSGGPGQCIAIDRKCDGIEQCDNGRDESDCKPGRTLVLTLNVHNYFMLI